MSTSDVNPLEDTESEAALAYAEERRENIREFVRTSPDYYIRNFDKIGASSRFTPTFNLMAGLFGPVWFGARGLWSWALPFLILETIAYVQIARGMFGDLAAEAMERIASIEGTLELRRQQLAAAIENNSDKIDVYQRTVDSLEENIGGIRAEAEAMAAEGPYIVLTGLIILIIVKLVQSQVANWALEARFSEWLSDRSIRSAMPVSQIVFSAVFMALIVAAAMMHYSFPGRFSLLSHFPTDPNIRLTSITWVEDFIAWCVRNSEAFFDGLTFGIRTLLDALEVILVQTPWIVIASLIILLTWLACFVWTFTYCTRYGYPTDVDPAAFPTVLGMPSWVVWGIVLPWSLANIVTLLFCFGFMQDATLEPDDVAEQTAAPSRAEDAGGVR